MEKSDFKKLVRYLTGDCTDGERSEVESWVSKDPLRKEYVETLKQAWELSGKLPLDRDAEEAWNRLSQRLKQDDIKAPLPFVASPWQKLVATPLPSTWRYVSRIAAAIVLMISIPYFAFQYFNPQQEQNLVMREIATGRGERVRVKFADGTRVMLNAASSIRFPEKGADGVREVQLRGEAYFEVARVENSQFVVKTDRATVQVLGTEFNVRSYSEDERISVVVRGGKVALQSLLVKKEEVLLTDGLMAGVGNDGMISPVISVNVDDQLAWVEGRMVFNDTPFNEVITELERRFDLDCAVSDSLVLQRRVKVAFREQNVNEILNVLALSLDLTYERIGTLVRFNERAKQQMNR